MAPIWSPVQALALPNSPTLPNASAAEAGPIAAGTAAPAYTPAEAQAPTVGELLLPALEQFALSE